MGTSFPPTFSARKHSFLLFLSQQLFLMFRVIGITRQE